MIYPKNFEKKLGFDEIQTLIKERCLSPLGKDLVDKMTFSTKADEINEWMEQVREFRRIEEEMLEFPLTYFIDCRTALLRIRVENTHLEEEELFDLRRSMDTINKIVEFLAPSDLSEDEDTNKDGWKHEVEYPFPALHRLSEDVMTFPGLVARIDQILDKFGHIRDTASPELAQIRRELKRAEGSVSRTLYNILRSAQSEGVVDKDVAPTLRDGRLVIPVVPNMKRRISGIVHDESATGKTVFIEPTEVVEANNKIRELESDERHEIIRILTDFTKNVRPHIKEILEGYRLMGQIDFIRAKAELSREMNAFGPKVERFPVIDWIRARHPLLEKRMKEDGTSIVPLDILLTSEKHILIISGPNAGGKSVCLKTVGLLQYMVQCGIPIPVDDRSKVGCFSDIMIDIGDEQSLENDLSTYSSHLLNMKNMIKQANNRTLILIDEFGTGTEPQIGGAIAEAVLEQFCKNGAWGVITTHYQNLKHFADSHDGVVNGAMLYDRAEMRPLFQLAIGRPGSSFAIEIARKIGLPEDVIKDASEIVGSDYIQSDKYLQDIVRDKRYWESKRQNIHLKEKKLDATLADYQSGLEGVEQQRKEILRKAKEEAEQLLTESNKRIENAIREIREKQAEKEETKKIRQELKEFQEGIDEIDMKAKDDEINRQIEKIKKRKERKEKRKAEKAVEKNKQAISGQNGLSDGENSSALSPSGKKNSSAGTKIELKAGDAVRIKGTRTKGIIESIDGKMATALFGEMKTKVPVKRLESADPLSHASSTIGTKNPADETNAANKQPLTKNEEMAERLQTYGISKETMKTMDEHRKNFHQDLDVRGMRGDEALNAVQYFIDDAILVGMSRVRILHGKGNGILRSLIRQYLASVPNVSHFADEHVQFGGAGITVVDIG